MGNPKLRTAETTAPLIEYDEGNIFNPLRKIQAQYARRARYLEMFNHPVRLDKYGKPTGPGAYFYADAAKSVLNLLPLREQIAQVFDVPTELIGNPNPFVNDEPLFAQ